MDQDYDALSIDEFCDRHRISRGTWYNLLKANKAPRFITVGSRRYISREAAEEWRREREAAAPAEFEAGCDKHRAARAKANKAKSRVRETAEAAAKTAKRP